MQDYTSLILVGLFGSGGAVALLSVILDHTTKRKNLEVERLRLEADKARPRKRVPLEHHPIFAAFDELEFFFMHSFRYSDKGRTLIVREMCVHKIRIWRRVLKKYAQDAQTCYESCTYDETGECNKSRNLISAMLIEGVKDYSTIYSTEGLKMRDVKDERFYDAVSLETMQVFIPIFNQWHDTRVESVRSASHDIPNSGLNGDCYEDYWDVLMIYLYAFIQMKYDAVGAIKQLNGQLTGREFLGVIVGETS
jgi:hypothetical protein